MPITKEQREARRLSIGSSDSPAIVGVDPYKSAADVWLEKTQELTESESSDQIEIGNDFERPLLQWAAQELGVELDENVNARREIAEVPFASNHDALVVRKPWGMEAKTGSSEGYGDEGTDQVPDRVLIQSHHQMLVSDLELVYVPVLLARFDHLERRIYKVERNEQLINLVRDRGVAFWKDNVLAKVQPEARASLEVLKRIKRVPKSVAEVEPALVQAFFEAQEHKRLSEKAEDDAKAAILLAMGECEACDYGDPAFWITYYEATRSGIDAKALAKAHPEIADEFQKVTTYRTMRRSKK